MQTRSQAPLALRPPGVEAARLLAGLDPGGLQVDHPKALNGASAAQRHIHLGSGGSGGSRGSRGSRAASARQWPGNGAQATVARQGSLAGGLPRDGWHGGPGSWPGRPELAKEYRQLRRRGTRQAAAPIGCPAPPHRTCPTAKARPMSTTTRSREAPCALWMVLPGGVMVGGAAAAWQQRGWAN